MGVQCATAAREAPELRIRWIDVFHHQQTCSQSRGHVENIVLWNLFVHEQVMN